MSEGATCPICGAAIGGLWATAHDVEYRTSDREYAYRQCAGCDVLYIDPIPAGSLAEIYPPSYYSYTAARGRSVLQRVKDWLDRRFYRRLLAALPGTSLRALDVGGGAGAEVSALRASDARVRHTAIVDLDPEAAELARSNGHAYFCGRIEDYAAPERFEVVLLLNLIEHVADPVGVLGKVASLLAPGGVVVVKTPNHRALDARLFRHRSWAGYHCPRHWVLFSPESFTLLAERAGLAVHRWAYTQGAPFWAASVLALFASRGWVRIDRERPVFRHPLFGALAALFAVFDFARAPFSCTSQMVFVLGQRRQGTGAQVERTKADAAASPA